MNERWYIKPEDFYEFVDNPSRKWWQIWKTKKIHIPKEYNYVVDIDEGGK